MQNANTISYSTSANEQIDNAELQEKSTVSDLDDNENDKESKNEDGIISAASESTTSPVVTDLNNGPLYVSILVSSNE